MKSPIVDVDMESGFDTLSRRRRARSSAPGSWGMALPMVEPVVVFGRRPKSLRAAPAMPSCEIVEMAVLFYVWRSG